MIETEIKYVLKDSFHPTIEGKEVISGNEYGGIKLVYTEKTTTFRRINILNIFKFKWKLSVNSKDVIFLRPFKKHWDKKNNRLAPYLWGNKSKPLTNIWVKVNSNFDNIATNYRDICFIKIYKNHITRGLFNRQVATINVNELI